MGLPGFNSDETKRPPNRAELARRDKAMEALKVWYQTQDEGEVAKALKVTKHSARVLINRGVELYEGERTQMVARYRARQQMDLEPIRAGWLPTAPTDRSSAEVFFKYQEREAKLQGLDAQKENEGPQVIVVNASTYREQFPDVVVEAEEIKEIGE